MEQERPYTETEPETAAETVETVPETAETPAETGEPAPKKPRESFFRRQRRELSDAWREIYCNSRARRIRTWQIAVFALLIVEVTRSTGSAPACSCSGAWASCLTAGRRGTPSPRS